MGRSWMSVRATVEDPFSTKKDASGWEDHKNLCLMATVEGGRECGTSIDYGTRYGEGYWNYVPEMTNSIPPHGPPQLQPVKKGTYFKRQETL